MPGGQAPPTFPPLLEITPLESYRGKKKYSSKYAIT